MSRGPELERFEQTVRSELEAAHAAREVALAACRRTIRACGNSIRATHRLETDRAIALADEAAAALAQAQEALEPHPALAAAGPLHDAEKEYAEARITAAFVTDAPLPSHHELGVSAPSWLGGLAEAASDAVMPGTISKSMPTLRSAAISSPARPKTSGSPPFSRTTVWPESARSTISPSISACGTL